MRINSLNYKINNIMSNWCFEDLLISNIYFTKLELN